MDNAKLHQIELFVEQEYGIPIASVKGEMRSKSVIRARRVMYFLLRNELKWSLPEIGAYMNKDHTTVLKVLRNFSAAENPELRKWKSEK